MSKLEEKLLTRWSGRTLLLGSFLIGVAGVAPLMLYIAFGPRDGNPIGLGLLAVFAVPVSGVGILAGLIKLLVELLGKQD